MVKKILFVALALVALQEAAQTDVEYDDNTKSIVNKIEKALENLKNIIERAVDGALEQFENIFNYLLDTAKGVITEASKSLNSKAEDAVDLIHKIVKDPSKSGVDATKCLLGKEEKIIGIPDDFIVRITGCIEENIKFARNIIAEAVSTVKDKNDIPTQLEVKVKECGFVSSAIPCLSKFQNEISMQIIQLPVKIAEEANILNTVGDIGKSSTECSRNSIYRARLQITSIVDEVKDCVKKVIEKNKPKEFVMEYYWHIPWAVSIAE